VVFRRGIEGDSMAHPEPCSDRRTSGNRRRARIARVFLT
jgi:hypothetical protein